MGAMKQSHVERGLGNKGFQVTNGDHKFFVYYSRSGKKTVVKTKTSHGGDRTLSAGLVSKMAKQVHLDLKDFERLVNCPLQTHEYENLLIVAGVSVD